MLRGMARFFGLKIAYVNYFAPDLQGMLLPREKRILIFAQPLRHQRVQTVKALAHVARFQRDEHLQAPGKTQHVGLPLGMRQRPDQRGGQRDLFGVTDLHPRSALPS